MTWDFAEANISGDAAGDFQRCIGSLCEVLDNLSPGESGTVWQVDATARSEESHNPLISTDPPYYDNISYADLSDFFYVWLRASTKEVFPELFDYVSCSNSLS